MARGPAPSLPRFPSLGPQRPTLLSVVFVGGCGSHSTHPRCTPMGAESSFVTQDRPFIPPQTAAKAVPSLLSPPRATVCTPARGQARRRGRRRKISCTSALNRDQLCCSTWQAIRHGEGGVSGGGRAASGACGALRVEWEGVGGRVCLSGVLCRWCASNTSAGCGARQGLIRLQLASTSGEWKQ